jgi:cell pole-organizing protein PopZ
MTDQTKPLRSKVGVIPLDHFGTAEEFYSPVEVDTRYSDDYLARRDGIAARVARVKARTQAVGKAAATTDPNAELTAALNKLSEQVAQQPAPVINVNVEPPNVVVHPPDITINQAAQVQKATRTRILKHDDKGRILETETSPVDDDQE